VEYVEFVKGATPVGFTSLTKLGFNLKRPYISKYTIFQLELEMDSLKNKLEGSVCCYCICLFLSDLC
jgi:hypothetical protein